MAFMQVSRKVDYALRAVIHLANDEHRGRACSVAEIADRERVPKQFLEKIIRDLFDRTGPSRRGPDGVRPRAPGRAGQLPASSRRWRADLLNVSRRARSASHGRVQHESRLGGGAAASMDLFQNTTIASVCHPQSGLRGV
jgi:hypothetical protein